jgi:hypothetical protein
MTVPLLYRASHPVHVRPRLAAALVSILARRRKSRSQFLSFRLTQAQTQNINRVRRVQHTRPHFSDDSHNTRKLQNMFPLQDLPSPDPFSPRNQSPTLPCTPRYSEPRVHLLKVARNRSNHNHQPQRADDFAAFPGGLLACYRTGIHPE